MILALHIGFLEITWVDLADICLVSGILYHVYKLMKGTLAIRIFVGFLVLYLVYLLVKAARMELLTSLLSQFAGVGVLALIVLFQQEIRRFLFLLGKTNYLGTQNKLVHNLLLLFGKQDTEIQLNTSEILGAIEVMSAERTGCLIAIFRETSPESLTELGDRLEAKLSKRLLLAIFNKQGPMHDGAVLIHENKILAARCILPISEQINLPSQFGTRHRAALGLSEQSNALIIVVSEETGHIAIVEQGLILHQLSSQAVRKHLQTYISGES